MKLHFSDFIDKHAYIFNPLVSQFFMFPSTSHEDFASLYEHNPLANIHALGFTLINYSHGKA